MMPRIVARPGPCPRPPSWPWERVDLVDRLALAESSDGEAAAMTQPQASTIADDAEDQRGRAPCGWSGGVAAVGRVAVRLLAVGRRRLLPVGRLLAVGAAAGRRRLAVGRRLAVLALARLLPRSRAAARGLLRLRGPAAAGSSPGVFVMRARP